MEDDLNFRKWKPASIFQEMEEDLHFQEMEDDLNFLGNGR
jgi:hypothetical protein